MADMELAKPRMTIEEALAFADEWSRGLTIHAGSQGWRVVCMLLAEELRKLRRHEYICQRCGLRKDAEPGEQEPGF